MGTTTSRLFGEAKPTVQSLSPRVQHPPRSVSRKLHVANYTAAPTSTIFERAVRQTVRVILPPFVSAWMRQTWIGVENVPSQGAVVIATNHVSYSDPFPVAHFLACGAMRWPHFLGKVEVFSWPLVGPVLLAAGQIPVHRGTEYAGESFADAVREIERGEAVVILPEGTVTHDKDLWPMEGKTGAARLALMTGSPLVPMAMWGPEKIIPPRTPFRSWAWTCFSRRHDVLVIAGPAVDLSDLRDLPLDSQVLDAATSRLMDAITELVAQLRGLPAPPSRMPNPKARSRKTRIAARGQQIQRRPWWVRMSTRVMRARPAAEAPDVPGVPGPGGRAMGDVQESRSRLTTQRRRSTR